MSETDPLKKFIGPIITEAALAGVAGVMAVIEAWNLFGLFALMAVLTPLWLIAVCEVVQVGKILADADTPPEDTQ